LHPTRVVIDKYWDDCDLGIFSEVISHVHEIQLHGTLCSSKQLLKLVKFCMTPQRLCISSPTLLCQWGLTSLLKACVRGSTLVDLEFHITFLKKATLVAILKRCPALQTLDVRNCPTLKVSQTLQDVITYSSQI